MRLREWATKTAIGESRFAPLCGIKCVSGVDESACANDLRDTPRINREVLIPFCQEQHDIGTTCGFFR